MIAERLFDRIVRNHVEIYARKLPPGHARLHLLLARLANHLGEVRSDRRRLVRFESVLNCSRHHVADMIDELLAIGLLGPSPRRGMLRVLPGPLAWWAEPCTPTPAMRCWHCRVSGTVSLLCRHCRPAMAKRARNGIQTFPQTLTEWRAT